jgi:hypothetical protein
VKNPQDPPLAWDIDPFETRGLTLYMHAGG